MNDIENKRVQDHHIVSKAGVPFKSEQAAGAAIKTRSDLDPSTHVVVKLWNVGDTKRFVICPKDLAPKGPAAPPGEEPPAGTVVTEKPKEQPAVPAAPSVSDEKRAIKQDLKPAEPAPVVDNITTVDSVVDEVGLNPMPTDEEIAAIRSFLKKEQIRQQKELPGVLGSSKADSGDDNERYYRVEFNAKTNPYDEDDVKLICNCETLIIMREREVIIPGRFREVADHAKWPHFRQLPNKPRKIISQIQLFPYKLIGEATREEYLAQKEKGNRQTAENIRRYGHDWAPDDF